MVASGTEVAPEVRGFALRIVPTAETLPCVVKVEARVPRGERLEHLTFALDGESLGVLEQAPWVIEVPAPRPGAAGVLSARGRLAGGGEIEDAMVVGAAGDRVEIRGVDLWVDVASPRHATLESARLQIFENGIEQAVDAVMPAREVPLEMAVLLDASPTMLSGGAMSAAISGVERWLRMVLGDDDRAALWLFRESVEIAVPFTGDPARLQSALDLILTAPHRATGGTAVRDSLLDAFDRLASRRHGGMAMRRALLLVTDGRDSASAAAVADLESRARRADIRLYVLLVGARQVGSELPRVARVTGGRAFRIRHEDAVGSTLRAIDRDLRRQYIVSYRSSHAGMPHCRRLTMAAAQNGRPLELRGISGYCP